jgi:murein DD-endopeptidase MepM/ murein hydrolase activator NlpD
MKKLGVLILLASITLVVYFRSETEVNGKIDDNVYELPFAKGTRHQVVQGYGGRFSHAYKAALDFEMPVGTPVYAARSGVVYAFKDDSDIGGLSPGYEKAANYIIIRHPDGTYGCYWHLRKGGVLTRKGAVSQGQVIGYSGATGMVLSPHLHFSVKARLSYAPDAFIQTRFRTTEGSVLLNAGSFYERPFN